MLNFLLVCKKCVEILCTLEFIQYFFIKEDMQCLEYRILRVCIDVLVELRTVFEELFDMTEYNIPEIPATRHQTESKMNKSQFDEMLEYVA